MEESILKIIPECGSKFVLGYRFRQEEEKLVSQQLQYNILFYLFAIYLYLLTRFLTDWTEFFITLTLTVDKFKNSNDFGILPTLNFFSQKYKPHAWRTLCKGKKETEYWELRVWFIVYMHLIICFTRESTRTLFLQTRLFWLVDSNLIQVEDEGMIQSPTIDSRYCAIF